MSCLQVFGPSVYIHPCHQTVFSVAYQTIGLYSFQHTQPDYLISNTEFWKPHFKPVTACNFLFGSDLEITTKKHIMPSVPVCMSVIGLQFCEAGYPIFSSFLGPYSGVPGVGLLLFTIWGKRYFGLANYSLPSSFCCYIEFLTWI